MERNAQAKRERILRAAFAEFAAKGLSGGRIDRIATAAGCNKSLIFLHFGSKTKLFENIVQDQLAHAEEQVQFDQDNLRASSERMIDFAAQNPDVVRLLAWHGLESRRAFPANLPLWPQKGQVTSPVSPTEEGLRHYLLSAIAVVSTQLAQRGTLQNDTNYRKVSKAATS